MIDDGYAIHYSAVERGTPIYSSEGTEVGSVDQVLDNYDEHIFDGIVLRTTGGDLRFVDAPEVDRTAQRAVTLSITAAQVEELPPPEQDPPPSLAPSTRGGFLGRIFGGGRRKS